MMFRPQYLAFDYTNVPRGVQNWGVKGGESDRLCGKANHISAFRVVVCLRLRTQKPTDYSLVSILKTEEHSFSCLTVLPHIVIFRISTSCMVLLFKANHNLTRESLVLQSPPWLLQSEYSVRYGTNKVFMQTIFGLLSHWHFT